MEKANKSEAVIQLKLNISETLMNAINRRDLNLLNPKNGRVEWGKVEKTIHTLIDEYVDKN